MLQNLLAERFQLKTHLESREFPAYELVIAKSGLKIKEAVVGDTPARTNSAAYQPTGDGWPILPPDRPAISDNVSFNGGYELDRVRAQLEPLSVLARLLPRLGRLPVVDKTGLTGAYSFTLEYTQELQGPTPDAPPIAPDIFIALRDQLGLQLIQKKLPFDVVVVDSFNKQPTEN